MVELTEKTAVMHTYGRFPLTLTKGKGSFVWDNKDNKYLDFTMGIATCNLGHAPDFVAAALHKQVDTLWHTSNLYHIENQETLAKLLVEQTCMDQVFFCNSGAEANEAAIKLARKFANDHNKPNHIITFQQSFHGRTLATLTATAQEKIQKGFAPYIPGFSYLPYNDIDALNELEHIQPCAVMLELVQGEGGVLPASEEWIDELVKVCKANNILIIVDEVQTGVGRTGTLYAYEQYGFEPDIITSAKGLGSGVPIGAMLAKEEIAASFTPGSHGSTFGGNPLVTAASIATLTYIKENNILANVKKQHAYLVEKLQTLIAPFKEIKSIRGKGLLLGLVVEENKANQYVEQARQEKLLILNAGPSVVRILPPLNVTREELDLFLEKMEKVLTTLA